MKILKLLLFALIIVMLLFFLTSCGYGKKRGTIIEKEFVPEHTSYSHVPIRSGKVTRMATQRHHYNDTWRIKIQKEEDGKIKECWIEITEEEYNKFKVGDYFEKEER